MMRNMFKKADLDDAREGNHTRERNRRFGNVCQWHRIVVLYPDYFDRIRWYCDRSKNGDDGDHRHHFNERKTKELFHSIAMLTGILLRLKKWASNSLMVSVQLALAILFPQHIRPAGKAVQHTRQHKQQVRQPIYIMPRVVVDFFNFA